MHEVITQSDGTEMVKLGDKSKKLPSEFWCRGRLIQLVEEAGGDIQHPSVVQFWKDRSEALGNKDALEAAWAREVFERLQKIWDELRTPPASSEDAFSGFGL